MPTLHVLQGPDKGRTYETFDESNIIGRCSDQISLSDNGSSRQHAEIKPDGDGWVLIDLKSSNGTYLNGQRVLAPMSLRDGDQIKIGGTLLVFSSKHPIDAAPRSDHVIDPDGPGMSGSSILAAIESSEESVILSAAEATDAVAAWNIVYQIAEMVGTVESVDLFLNRLADIIVDHIVVDQLVLFISDDESASLHPRVVRSMRGRQNQPGKIVASQTIIDHVMQKKEGVLCANAQNDQRFTDEDLQDSIHRYGLRSVICVPILGRTQLHGVLHLDCSMSHHTYTQEQLRLAVAIGRLAGMSIENARLLEERMRTERLAAAGETVAYLSHHIRNILQGMQSGVDVVEMSVKKLPHETIVSGWALVRRNLDRIYNLALNMLTFSKERCPHIELDQLNDVVTDAIELVRTRAEEKSTKITVDLDELPPVPLDREGVHQVAQNILRNAIEAVEEERGHINISTTYDSTNGTVALSITDNGPGIPASELQKVFNAFHSTKGHGGTGLGLAAAKKIVDELGGELAVSSEVGKGTTFRLTLSIDHVELAPDATHP